MDHRNSKRLPGYYGASSTNHGHIFLALLNGPCFVRCFAGLLCHGYVFEEEGSQDDSPAEHKHRYEAMLDCVGQREPERLKHLVEQVLSLLYRLRRYRSCDLVMLWAERHMCDSALRCNVLCRVYHRSTVRRIDQRLWVGRCLQPCGCELVCDGSRETLGDIAGKGMCSPRFRQLLHPAQRQAG